MKITNASNLPEVVFKWLEQDMYDGAGNSISATTLLKPVQEYWLTKRHWNEIEVDAIDRVWSLFGQGVHSVLEKLQGDYQQEERLYAEIEGVQISGKFDLVHNNTLLDYKTTSSWTILYGDRKEEWSQQLSIYRWLYNKSKGIKLNDIATIVVILRDWSRGQVERVKGYPIVPILEIPIELMSLKDTESFIRKKVLKIGMYIDVQDEVLPECTDEEMWFNAKKKQYIKCDGYCNARSVCPQKKRRESNDK